MRSSVKPLKKAQRARSGTTLADGAAVATAVVKPPRGGYDVLQMRFGIRWGLVPGKICVALLLAAVSPALIIPGSEVALGQRSTGTIAQPPMFTAIDLTPSGYEHSKASGVSGEQQVGNAWVVSARSTHALLWRGSAASVVDLNPSGFDESTAYDICGAQQVGYGSGPGTAGNAHALLWGGGAGRVVDLHPSGFTESFALGISGGQQVGYGLTLTRGLHALLWRGSAASVVDLNPPGFIGSQAFGASGGQQVGVGSGPATGDRDHALLWRGNPSGVADLNPRGFITSHASGVSGGQQVGSGVRSASEGSRALLWHGSAVTVVDLTPRGFSPSVASSTNGEEQVGVGNKHALLWRGSAASAVDLHAFLPPGFRSSAATRIDANGDIVGYAEVPSPAIAHAFLWRRNAPKPASPGNATRCDAAIH